MKSWIAVVVLAFTLVGCGKGFEIVDSGYRGVRVDLGKVSQETLLEGIHSCNPLTCTIYEMDTRIQKWEGKSETYTKDVQVAHVDFVVTYYPESTKMHELFQSVGRDWQDKLVTQAVLGKMKAVIGHYNAEDLVANRDRAAQEAEKEVREALETQHVHIKKLELVNVKFNPEFEKAVEDKVVATQRAKEELNRTEQVKEQAKQKMEGARAEAESMKIRAQALNENRKLVEYEMVQAFKAKWDGKLPQYNLGGGANSGILPILNMKLPTEKE